MFMRHACAIGLAVLVLAPACNEETKPGDTCTPVGTAANDRTCDGVDDDCDGTTDEDYASEALLCGVGACANHGATSCVAGAVEDACSPGTPAVDDATCDGVDDDCSGATDEDYAPEQVACGVGACASHGVTVCLGGEPQAICSAGTPAGSDATCDGADDDCDGETDEDFAEAATSCGVGACVASGHLVCAAGAVSDTCVGGTPAADDASCNGVDDDCDGTIDNAYLPTETACGVGGCLRRGFTLCVAGQATDVCTAGAPAAKDPSCDHVDDDCDGATDEDCTTPTPPPPCVARGVEDATCDGIDDNCDGVIDDAYVAVVGTCGVGACARSGLVVCNQGIAKLACAAGNAADDDRVCNHVDDDCDGATDEGCSVEPPACTATAQSDATCDGKDDDCDGMTDENAAPADTTCGKGACTRHGVASCVDGHAVSTCLAGSPAADDASCDGIDNDCDDRTDEDFAPRASSCGTGACAATGTVTCVDGRLVDGCHAGVSAATDTTCDGKDDDCDGRADEDRLPETATCGSGACLRHGVAFCIDGALREVCEAGSAAAADATCDGKDDDCDGATDEDYVGPATHCGEGSCVAAGHLTCAGGIVSDTCVARAPTSGDASCNGVDDDCDGSIDEEFLPTETQCGIGGCARQGFTLCVAGHPRDVCTSGAPAANDASCNRVDEDCDGATDEDCLDVTPPSCVAHGVTDATCDGVDDDCDGRIDEDYTAKPGACGVGGCERAGLVVCNQGATKLVCAAGQPAADDHFCNAVDEDCNGVTDDGCTTQPPACTATATSDPTCDGKDDDCDGRTDEDAVPADVTCGKGACVRHGIATCVAGHALTECSAGAAAANDASCDGVDNDCDDRTDEDFAPRASSCGTGACAATGTITCVAGDLVDGCHAGSGSGSDATCDGKDDDCDGGTDEDRVPMLSTCGDGLCLRYGVSFCIDGDVRNVCQPGVPGESAPGGLLYSTDEAYCEGADNDCDGATDEAFVPYDTQCGTGACAATGRATCGAGGAFSDSCHAGAPLAAQDTTDNNVDDDCDGTTDDEVCVIDGAGYDAGAVSGYPVACRICDARHPTEWTLQEGYCLIGGACFANGAANPYNACQICDAAQPTVWSSKPNTCEIGGGCYAAGETHYYDACQVCDPAHRTEWSLKPDTCFIDGSCRDAGAADPYHSCQVCDPARPAAWTLAPDTCLIDNSCVAAGASVAGCSICDPAHPTEPTPASSAQVFGLLAYYPFDGDVRDHADGAHDAVAGSVTYVPAARYGHALSLTGNESIVVNNAADLAPLADRVRTFVIAVETRQVAGRLGGRVVSQVGTNEATTTFTIDIHDIDESPESVRWQVDVGGQSGTALSYAMEYSQYSHSVQTRTFVVVIGPGLAGTKIFDGSYLMKAGAVTLNTAASVTTPLRIGGGGATATIDSLAIYDRATTAIEGDGTACREFCATARWEGAVIGQTEASVPTPNYAAPRVFGGGTNVALSFPRATDINGDVTGNFTTGWTGSGTIDIDGVAVATTSDRWYLDRSTMLATYGPFAFSVDVDWASATDIALSFAGEMHVGVEGSGSTPVTLSPGNLRLPFTGSFAGTNSFSYDVAPGPCP